MRERILVLGAHPDDCEIAIGGTVVSYARRGHEVAMVTLRIPADNHDSCPKTRARRQAEGQKAAQLLGVNLSCLELTRDQIQPDATLVGTFDRLLGEIQPTSVYTHWVGDSHPEHVGAARAILAATRRNRCSVYMFEPTMPGGVTEQAFRPQKFVDISDSIDQKMASLSCYETQLERYGQGWLEAIRGRAAQRGFQIGCQYAEAFEVVKEITSIPELKKAAGP